MENVFVEDFHQTLIRNPYWRIDQMMEYHEYYWGIPLGPALGMVQTDCVFTALRDANRRLVEQAERDILNGVY